MSNIYLPVREFTHHNLSSPANMHSVLRDSKVHFSEEENLGDFVVAIDPQKNILMHYASSSSASRVSVIDLNEVTSCTMIKEYSGISAGELESKGLSHFLKKIFLLLRFRSSATLFLPMFRFNKGNKNRKKIEKAEAKTGRWKTLITGDIKK